MLLIRIFLVMLSSLTLLPAVSQPNIVLIMVDDMGYSDIGCYGGEIKTPNLDALAAGGMRFSQFYNNAKCTTTRATLVTGLYPRQARGNYEKLLGTDMVTLGEVLGSAGYHTVLSGKWHLGHDKNTHPYYRGFHEVYGLLDGGCNHFDPSIVDPPYKGGRKRYFAHNDKQVTNFPPDWYSTDAFTDHAISQLRVAVKRKQPCFLHITYTAPHYPLHALPADIEKYLGTYREGWDVLRQRRYARQCELGVIPDPTTCPLSVGDPKVGSWEKANQAGEDRRMAVYAAMVDRVDQAIGRLVAALKETGQFDNTIIMFLSDNGGCAEDMGPKAAGNPGPKDDYVCVGPGWGWASNTPFRRYKSWIHEGGISTPFIVHWPGHVKANSWQRNVAHIIDIMPTVCELGGTTYPTEMGDHPIIPAEGRSLLPLFAGENVEPRTLAWSWNGSRGLREGDFKVVWAADVKQWELYDLAKDRSETNNLATSQPNLTQRLVAAWNDWAKKTEAVSDKKSKKGK